MRPQKPLAVEIGKPPQTLRLLVSLASADARDVAYKLERMWNAALSDYERHEDIAWASILRFDESSARVLHEIMCGIESGKHKVVEPELHQLRQTMTLMRRATVNGLHERSDRPITRNRLHLLRGASADLTDLSTTLDRACATLPEDLVIDALGPKPAATSDTPAPATGIVRLLRDIREELRSVHLSGVEVRIRLIEHEDDPRGKESAEDAIPQYVEWIGKLPVGRRAEVTRTVILWTSDPEPIGFNQTAQRLRDIATQGGAIVRSSKLLPDGWSFRTDEEFWWSMLFETAWSDSHATLRTKKHAWITGTEYGPGLVLAPYNTTELQALVARHAEWRRIIPAEWLKELPASFLSDLDNVAWASMVCCDLLEAMQAESGQPTHEPSPSEAEPRSELKPLHRNAYASYERAMNHFERDITDEEAYEWLKEQDPEHDYELPPSFETWQRYVRKARQALGTQKYQTQKSVLPSKSIVQSKNI